jgi:hypothetical protein
MMNRFVLPCFCLIPVGYQGELVGEPVTTPPKGIPLPADPTVTPITDMSRVINLFSKNNGWNYQAVLKVKDGSKKGYIAYKHEGQDWRIRVRGWEVTTFDTFKMNLSGQITQVALFDEAGNELQLELVAAPIALDNAQYADLPTY